MKLKTVKILMLILACLAAVFLILSYCFQDDVFVYCTVTPIIAAAIISFLFYRCPHCGRYLGRSLARYCPHCGEKLE